MNDTAHQEKHFESYIVSQLVAQGWLVGESAKYDTERAMYPEDLIGWLEDSGQGDKWAKIQKDHGAKALDALMDRLAKVLESHGTVHLLRRGFSLAGCGRIDLSEAAPEDLRNESVLKRYAAHRLRVVPQLKYHPARALAIDLVLFVNGLPVATVEIKTDFTQSVEAAIDQYRTDRLPMDPKTKRKEPLLTFKRGAVVHFAMSDTEIYMATKLDGLNTVFLPFNQGHEGHAGNPPSQKGPDGTGDYRVAYFWQKVCQRDAWLRIFHSFVYVEKKTVVDLKGSHSTRETQIFPRYHQWSAVNEMIADARTHGAGMTYLCDHSAGSGKTSTISWTAHDLVKLRRDNGESIFNSVIIVTDRNVLDSQLQDAVKQIDHQFGVIAAIDRQKSSKSKSAQLAEALISGTPIIVVTIQTFPYAMEAIVTEKGLKSKNFAVIIDEAHNSQKGSIAAKLQTALSLSGSGKNPSMTVEELLEALQKSRACPKNISYFAFTGTPKHDTMMLFGRPADPSQPGSGSNLPQAFHRYPMRQAIEEGFILDVLKGYVPYKTAFHLAKQLEDKKRVSGKAAKRALAQWMALHPTNVTQKVQMIIEHFSRNVAHRLDGKAKAMVVTSSRAAAIRYKKRFDDYVAAHPEYSGIRSLIAFSGKMTGKQVMHADDERLAGDIFMVDEDEEFTEESMNPDAGGKDLRHVFDRPEYRVMLVADKFQTGFDQPKLVAMYVDKKIANAVEIAQTFSRLNRTAPGKDEVFILDFVNDPETVRAAFALYDNGAQLDEVQDPNVVYEIKDQLDAQGIYESDDLEAFKAARFKTLRDITHAKEPEHKALYQATDRVVSLYDQRLKMLRDAISTWESAFEKAYKQGDKTAMDAADHHREEYADQIATLTAFKTGMARFCRTYAYVAQLIDFCDPELENFVAFARLVVKRLSGEAPENIDLNGLVLTGFDIKLHDDTVSATDAEIVQPILTPVGPGGGGSAADKPRFLTEVIDRLNRLFGDVTPTIDQAALVNHILGIVRENDVVMAQVENNTQEQALKGNLPGAVQQAVVRALSSDQKNATLLLKSDRQAMDALTILVYELIRDRRNIDLDGLRV